MVDYSYLSEELLNAVRSLPGYQYFARFLKSCGGYSFIYDDKRVCRFYHMQFEDKERNQFELIIQRFGEARFLEACKAVHNSYMRTTRVKQRLQYIMQNFGQMYFVTFTIDEDNIDDFSNNVTAVCKLCSLILKKVSTVYVFNTDYGDRRGRFHLHACVSADLDSVQSYKTLWPYGRVDIERVGDSDCDKRKLARYQTKLARHATKQTAFKICYSRLKKGVVK